MGKMGEWKLSGVGNCIVISSGVVAVESKDPEQVADFSLRYWEIKKMFEDNPNASTYVMTKQTYMGLIRAVHDGKLDRLGEIFTETRNIDVAEDSKRDYRITRFTALPKCGGDLLKKKYKSKAIDISQVISREINITED